MGDVVPTDNKQEDGEELAGMHTPAGAKGRRRLGLLLLLVGLALVGGGLFLPWRLADRPRGGRPHALSAADQAFLDAALEQGPQAYGMPVMIWSIRDLQALL